MNYIFLLSGCLCFSLSLIIIYFIKSNISSKETRVYSVLLFTNFVGILLEIGSIYLSLNYLNLILCSIIIKLYFAYIILYLTILLYYVYEIYENTANALFYKKIKIFTTFLLVAGLILVFVLPFEKHSGFATGTCVDFIYIYSSIIFVMFIASIYINRTKIQLKKILPILILGPTMLIITFIQKNIPEMTISTAAHFLSIFIMYHTIENPDVKMLNEVNLAKDQAEQANQAKTDFLSSMSHEIRTPLNAIVGFSSVIANADNLEEAKENAKDIVEASNTLLDIVNGILDISKIEAGKLELINKDYNAYELFDSAAKLIELKMKEKGLDFQVNIAPDLPKVLYGDAANLKKVVVNLLSNAYKYTDTGSVSFTVTSVINKDFCRLVIAVEDTGRGIKKEHIDKLFSKFQRLDEDRNTTIEGTGLGLAITKQLVEMMGGTIVCQSVYGSGSKFTIALDQRITSMFENKSQTINVKEAPLNVKDKRILIVDDNTLNLKVAARLLKSFNPEIDTAESGFECLEKISNGEKYDLILLDDMMPKLSGTETLQRLKDINGFVTPVIALTANAISGMKEQYISKGFDDYLAKPIEKPELIRVFKTFLMEHAETVKIDFGALPEDMYIIDEANAKDLMPATESVSPFPKAGLSIQEPVIEKEESLKEEVQEEQPIEDTTKEVNNEVTSTESTEAVYDIEYLKNNDVDVDKGIELLGDEEAYRDTMIDFYNGIKERVIKLNEYIKNKDMESYAIDVHALKSDAKYLGLTKLSEIALEEEMKSKDNDYDYIKKDFTNLMIELKKDIGIMRNYLKK